MNSNICNHCGGEYEYRGGRWKCRWCGSYKQESLSSEEEVLLDTAYQTLRLTDFVEAEAAFDDFIQKFPENPSGYWGRLMARFGIKYEQDFDGHMIPSCYAMTIGSVTAAADYKKALKYADAENAAYYKSQAAYLERVRTAWLSRAKQEEPYDIFLCYKDSDAANGIERTRDSYAAQELYTLLTDMGFRVFYSRVSLRGKVGEKYEPYIFQALSTAKVMIVYGSTPDYIQSTWMKNEWMRYLKQMREGKKKPDSLLVVCDGFSPVDLPQSLAAMPCFRAEERTFYGELKKTVNRLFGRKQKQVTSPWKMKFRKFLIALFTVLTLLSGQVMLGAFDLAVVLGGGFQWALFALGALIPILPLTLLILNIRFVLRHTVPEQD